MLETCRIKRDSMVYVCMFAPFVMLGLAWRTQKRTQTEDGDVCILFGNMGFVLGGPHAWCWGTCVCVCALLHVINKKQTTVTTTISYQIQ